MFFFRKGNKSGLGEQSLYIFLMPLDPKSQTLQLASIEADQIE
jgi:hypothetical protein